MKTINAIIREYVPASPDTGLPELLLATADGDRTFGGWDIPEDEFKFGLLDVLHPDNQAGLRMFGPGNFCRLEEDEGGLVGIGNYYFELWYRPEPVDPPTAEERLALIGRTLDWLFYDAGGIHRTAVEATRDYMLGMNCIALAIAHPDGGAFEPGLRPDRYAELMNSLRRNPNGLLDKLVRFKAVKL